LEGGLPTKRSSNQPGTVFSIWTIPFEDNGSVDPEDRPPTHGADPFRNRPR
jgi:hypothetical protein